MRVPIAIVFFSASILFTSPSQPMELSTFNGLAGGDQRDYIEVLVQCNKKSLRQAGRQDLANELDYLFGEIKPGNRFGAGMSDFELNLAAAAIAELNPDVRDIQIEDVLKLTAERRRIPWMHSCPP